MKIKLVDGKQWLKFAPLTFTKPVAEIRMGFFTNTERYKFLLPACEVYFETEKYLQNIYKNTNDPCIEIPANLIPNEDFIKALSSLKSTQSLKLNNEIIAKFGKEEIIEFEGETPVFIEERWHLYERNDLVCHLDFSILSKNKKSQEISSTNTIIGSKDKIFLEEGAKIEASIINTNEGFIYLGRNAEIMEGSMIRGILMMGNDSVLKLGTKVYGANTIGPGCKVGGEINNVVFQDNSNKGHDGFLGNTLIGSWCNLGADTNTSNLKNNYGKVKTFSYEVNQEIQTDITFMGLTMGDHSKCGINTMFNTAAVVGTSAILFSGDFALKHVPSFSWGEKEKFNFEKAIEAINNMMSRRGKTLSEAEIEVLRVVFDKSITEGIN